MSGSSELTTFHRDGTIGVIRLNRPDALNAISGAMADELRARFEEVAALDDIWVVVLGATGDRAFCVGADLKERMGFSLDDFYRNREQIRGMFAALRDVPQPTIASVFGFVLGGGFELALSCDLIIASKEAEFGLPEVRVGLLPAGGGTQLLPRKIGVARAKELIYRGRRFGSEYAHAVGLVADIADRDELGTLTSSVARELCKSSPVAVRAAKRSIDVAIGVSLEEGIGIEDEAWRKVISSLDRTEGISAFNEKRHPRWSNK